MHSNTLEVKKVLCKKYQTEFYSRGGRPSLTGLVVGITGSFGTGKSTVARIFASLGARIIDADKIVHGILGSDNKVSKKIINVFGKGVLDNSKNISRKNLGKVVFQNKKLLKRLRDIIHPEVIEKIKAKIRAFSAKDKKAIIAIEAPLLIEAGLLGLVDKLVVVVTSKNNQIKRIQKKMNLSSNEIKRRIDAQLPLKTKIKLADYVVDNNKDTNFTKRQVKEIYKKILKQVK